ncbi:MAG TPA: substrate-binding domain-containing protein [Aggregatilinea sp.]|uniref:autoinducer 2 ABC transporter substrate-binding protein n=1 Tax=Aggregatilinea sp. TaxID=2806333 RepID=UPI002C953608|nr:substrate-binding domain-containing protein [Aggregatilinea sp.]HML21898.1 substrate-binding domain-containing protein [Aggregatilinea sp.]
MLKRTLIALIVLTLVAGPLAFAAPAKAQDDLPTNPLACPGEDEMAADATMDAEATAIAEEAMTYDGGQPVDAPDKAGQAIRVLDLPKLIGIAYFAATTKGMNEAADELGNVEVITDAPTEANVDDQITFIENYVTQGIDGIMFASNDPVAISPALRRALEAGVHVVGFDANSEPDAREWFVNQATFNGMAKALVDSMVEEVGADGSVAIITSSLTAPNQNRWISEMLAYSEKCYPDLNYLETVPSEEDQQLAFQRAQELVNKYGSDLDGIFAMSSVAAPGGADALSQMGVCEDTVVIGISTPNQMRPFVKNGCAPKVVLWNPVDLGYATVYVMRAVVDGTLLPGATEVEAGRLGTLPVVNGSEILLGPPTVFTTDNIDDFDF